MKKMTLLEMVQNISSAMDLDEINSITDTTEALQIAEIVKETFYEQFNNISVPELYRLFTLESVSSLDSPNYLKIPEDISKILWLKYKDYRAGDRMNDVPYVTPEEFLQTQLQYTYDYNYGFQTTDPSSGIKYYISTRNYPTRFTVFDDNYLAFDAIDLDYETSLIGANSIGYGMKSFDFLMDDNFIPPLDGNLFPLLLAESKSVAFINLKQVASAKEERRATRQRIRMQNDQHKARQAQYRQWNDRNNYSRNR